MPLFFQCLLAFRNGYPCLRAFVYSRLLPRASRGRVEGEEVMVSRKKTESHWDEDLALRVKKLLQVPDTQVSVKSL